MKFKIAAILAVSFLTVGLTACESEAEKKAEAAAEAKAEVVDAPEEVEEGMEEAAEEMVEEVGTADTLSINYGDTARKINSVVMRRVKGQHAHLAFYEQDVDCASIKEIPGDADDRLVLTAEVTSGLEGVPEHGPMVVKKWEYFVDGDNQDVAPEGEIEVVKATPTEIDGTVRMTGKIDDDAIEFDGPFVATICDVDVAPDPS